MLVAPQYGQTRQRIQVYDNGHIKFGAEIKRRAQSDSNAIRLTVEMAGAFKLVDSE